jgi:pyruvate/2-oxoglutarate/acetoin dehydrogenase E1 component
MISILKRINQGLHNAFAQDEKVYLIGEDLLDPYGGAFKVSAGLSSKYPDRVISSPISEAAIVGVAGGMALRGMKPVVEIMFGDFTTLIADQLINSLTKFRWMYNEQVDVPVVIRTPMGGRRGYGPTHSQTLEKLFLGVPGLRVIAVNSLQDPAELIESAILKDTGPVLVIENKLLYAKNFLGEKELADFDVQRIQVGDYYAASFLLQFRDAPAPSFTMVSYGYMAELARKALSRLAFEEE